MKGAPLTAVGFLFYFGWLFNMPLNIPKSSGYASRKYFSAKYGMTVTKWAEKYFLLNQSLPDTSAEV